MKRIAFVVGVAVLVLGVAILAKTQAGSVEQELIKLETEWAEAIGKRDVTTIEKMLSDDFMGTAPDGSLYTKAQLFELMKSYKGEISYVTDEWNVRVYGDAAVVNARNTVKMRSEAKESSVQERYTDTWIKKDGRWKCVAGHNSVILKK